MRSCPRQVQLSKFLSLILRHQPEKFGLTLDAQGFVPLADLLAAIQREPGWDRVTEEDIWKILETSDKPRFEIRDGKIRARYGHSVLQQIPHPEVEPPAVLYHGTSPASLLAIREMGLRSMMRQYVHLSPSLAEARKAGRRRHPNPIVLIVQARAAWQAGVKFFRPHEQIYLSTAIPAEFIQEAGEGSREASHHF